MDTSKEPIAKGGTAVVFEAELLELGQATASAPKKVAVKFIHMGRTVEDQVKNHKAFLQEVNILRALSGE